MMTKREMIIKLYKKLYEERRYYGFLVKHYPESEKEEHQRGRVNALVEYAESINLAPFMFTCFGKAFYFTWFEKAFYEGHDIVKPMDTDKLFREVTLADIGMEE